MLVAGRAVASAALAFPAALFGDPDNGQRERHDQNHQSNNSANRQHKKDLSFAPKGAVNSTTVYIISRRRATKTSHAGRKCAGTSRRSIEKTANENLGLQFLRRHGIISLFQFGGLAQLVRASASHAGGLGFESLILHHTVRTRTRFFMKKGSGTFFVYKRFCGRTTRNGKQERTKAGYHHDGSILPLI